MRAGHTAMLRLVINSVNDLRDELQMERLTLEEFERLMTEPMDVPAPKNSPLIQPGDSSVVQFGGDFKPSGA
jgi:hypothetical protein